MFRCLMVAAKILDICRSELNEGLEEIPLFSAMAGCMPKTFEHFVAFPPVGIVVEVDPMEVIL